MRHIHLLAGILIILAGPALAQDAATCNTIEACSTALKCNNDDSCLAILRGILNNKLIKPNPKLTRTEVYSPGGIWSESQQACRGQMKLSPNCKPMVLKQICEVNGGRDCHAANQAAPAAGPKAGAQAPGKTAQVARFGGMMIIGGGNRITPKK